VPLSTGLILGHYVVADPIGKGGMGEVYRARDTKLGRDVAIKVLPEIVSQDIERLRRFEREARLLAQLNHTNIATIHGLEESEGRRFLVMELVAGETMAERVSRGPIPVDEALPLFIQIAEGLDAAHEKGILHRDLKPANVKITPDGKVKILDFGLAKALSPTEEVSAEMSQSPTWTRGADSGAIEGTASYMSPEQARGKAVDRRTDVWAFGCCLYEVLAGRKAFEGETVTDVLAAIVHKEPDPAALPAATPPLVRQLILRCLRKEPRRRFRDVADIRIELEEAVASHPGDAPAPAASKRGGVLGYLAVAVAAALLAMLLARLVPVPETPLVRLTLATRHRAVDLGRTTGSVFALSPDGRSLVYAGSDGGTSHLYVRALDDFEPKRLPGTEGARYPFFSTNGPWVGFVSGERLGKIPLDGSGPTMVEKSVGHDWGMSWGPDGDIVLGAAQGGLLRLSGNGGQATPLTQPRSDRGELTHASPHHLPNGRGLVFTVATRGGSRVAFLSLGSGDWHILEDAGIGGSPKYVDPGYIVFARVTGQGADLLGARFDAIGGRLESVPTVLVRGVEGATVTGLDYGYFDIAESGTLAYLAAGSTHERSLVWVDAGGRVSEVTERRRNYEFPRISPRGDRIAVTVHSEEHDVWVHEIGRDALTRMTTEGNNSHPIWTPDGNYILHPSNREGGRQEIHRKKSDGTGESEAFLPAENRRRPGDFTSDGRVLVFWESDTKTQADIWVGEVGSSPRPLIQTSFNEYWPRLSPDGRFLSYTSDESGRDEVYVQPFPAVDRRWLVSTNGGREALWSRDGREIFYREDDKMMSVAVDTLPEFAARSPQLLFENAAFHRNLASGEFNYDVAPDGRFLMIRRDDALDELQINVVLNWTQELKRLVTAE